MSRVINNFTAVRDELAKVCAAAGRADDDVKLLVVSKTIPISVLMELYDIGVREFGENREGELSVKADAMPKDIIWHFIGPIQSNKIRKVVKIAKVIHSVESLSQLERFERIAAEEGVCPEVLLEINVSGELSKGGMTPEEFPDIARRAAECANIRFSGVMTMAPLDADADCLRDIFTKLRSLRDAAEKDCGKKLPILSMGMSGDFAEAVGCGSTLVRIGSRIFEGIERISK